MSNSYHIIRIVLNGSPIKEIYEIEPDSLLHQYAEKRKVIQRRKGRINNDTITL